MAKEVTVEIIKIVGAIAVTVVTALVTVHTQSSETRKVVAQATASADSAESSVRRTSGLADSIVGRAASLQVLTYWSRRYKKRETKGFDNESWQDVGELRSEPFEVLSGDVIRITLTGPYALNAADPWNVTGRIRFIAGERQLGPWNVLGYRINTLASVFAQSFVVMARCPEDLLPSARTVIRVQSRIIHSEGKGKSQSAIDFYGSGDSDGASGACEVEIERFRMGPLARRR